MTPSNEVMMPEASVETTLNTKDELVRSVRKWGSLNTDAILDPLCKIFTTPDIQGLIGYKIESQCAVVFGDPLCAPSDKPRLAKTFKKFCEEQKLDLVYTIISPEFAKQAVQDSPCALIQFGNTLVLDPSDNPMNKKGSKAGLIRKKVKHAQKDGIGIYEYISDNPKVEKAIEQIGLSWLQRRHGPQIYISHMNLLGDREGKRWFYAKQGEQVVGFLLLHELQAEKGWLLNNLIISTDAPTGTSELLITETLNTLDKENCKRVVVGPVTSTRLEKIVGLSSFTSWIVRAIFRMANKLFRLNGQTTFWEKFQAETEPSYILFEKVNFRSIKALLNAMNVSL